MQASDTLYGAVHAGKKKRGVRHLPASGNEKENDFQTLYAGKYASWEYFLSWRRRFRHIAAAGSDDGNVCHGKNGLSSAHKFS